MADHTIRVVYRKYDGTLHWNHDGWRLGEDEHGVWVDIPAGTDVRRNTEPLPPDYDSVLVFPRDQGWTASFNAPPTRTEIYCDVTTVPQWRDGEVTMVDLDLDVRRRRDGTVEVLDEDEFAEHQLRYGYPDDVIARAQATTLWLERALSTEVEPFASAYHHWLKLARQHR
ncbi:MAG: DUF402 domain-containing protein [Micromonosporaceae bacterium]